MKPNPQVLGELSNYQAWASNSSSPITLLDYVGFVGTPDLLFAFAALFQPDVLVHDGFRFLASGFTAATYDSWKQRGLSGPAIQKVMNHVHISTLFQNQEVNDEVAVEASSLLRDLWRRTLDEDLAVESGGTCLHSAFVTFFDAT
jgi:hypothetical protein